MLKHVSIRNTDIVAQQGDEKHDDESNSTQDRLQR